MPRASTVEVLAIGVVWNENVDCGNFPEPEIARGAAVICARGEGPDSGHVEEFPEPELVSDGGDGCDIEELVEPEVAGAGVLV